MCMGKTPKPAAPPAPPPPAPAPPPEVQEIGSARKAEDETLGRTDRANLRVDRALSGVASDGAGLRL